MIEKMKNTEAIAQQKIDRCERRQSTIDALARPGQQREEPKP